MRRRPRVLLLGGGSGGHIIPNFVIAKKIRESLPAVEFLYIGSRKPMDRELVEAEGIPFRAIFTGKIRRYFSWQNFVDPFLLVIGFFQALGILMRFRPNVIFSKGGYVSVPVALAAFVLRYPLVLHESDSRMGIANRIAARFAKRVCVAFPTLAKGRAKFVCTGNPVREGLTQGDPEKGYALTGFTGRNQSATALPVVLVYGGSQGAQQINDMVNAEFVSFVSAFQVVHVTGAGKGSKIQHKNYRSFEYLGDELSDIYAITDLIVSRAGAGSLSEIALLGKPAVLIPLGNSDQKQNAAYFADHGAAILLKEGERLTAALGALAKDENRQKRIRKTLSTLAKADASKEIAKIAMEAGGLVMD